MSGTTCSGRWGRVPQRPEGVAPKVGAGQRQQKRRGRGLRDPRGDVGSDRRELSVCSVLVGSEVEVRSVCSSGKDGKAERP